MTLEYVESYRDTLAEVVEEKIFLLTIEPPQLERSLAYVEGLLKRNATMFVALDGARVVGWCDIDCFTNLGVRHVGRMGMGVLKDYRGQGIGERLLRLAIDDALAKGLTRIELGVFSTNRAAIKLYKKLGFELEGTRRRARQHDNAYDDIHIMALLK